MGSNLTMILGTEQVYAQFLQEAFRRPLDVLHFLLCTFSCRASAWNSVRTWPGNLEKIAKSPGKALAVVGCSAQAQEIELKRFIAIFFKRLAGFSLQPLSSLNQLRGCGLPVTGASR